MPKNETESFVKLENSNMIKLSLKQLAGLYADYAYNIIHLKKLCSRKQEIRKQLFGKINELQTKYDAFVKDLPELPKGIKIPVPKYPKEEPSDVEYIKAPRDSFENLMDEFEDIRAQLEKLR